DLPAGLARGAAVVRAAVGFVVAREIAEGAGAGGRAVLSVIAEVGLRVALEALGTLVRAGAGLPLGLELRANGLLGAGVLAGQALSHGTISSLSSSCPQRSPTLARGWQVPRTSKRALPSAS